MLSSLPPEKADYLPSTAIRFRPAPISQPFSLLCISVTNLTRSVHLPCPSLLRQTCLLGIHRSVVSFSYSVCPYSPALSFRTGLSTLLDIDPSTYCHFSTAAGLLNSTHQ